MDNARFRIRSVDRGWFKFAVDERDSFFGLFNYWLTVYETNFLDNAERYVREAGGLPAYYDQNGEPLHA